MKTSVSMRTSAILLRPPPGIGFCPDIAPPPAGWDFEIRHRAEESVQVCLKVDLGGRLLLQVAVDGLADQLGQGLPLALGKLVEAFSLLAGQVDLRPRAGHRAYSIQQRIQH